MKNINTSSQRQCSKCKEIKPLSVDNFHRSKNRYLGFEYICKMCAKVLCKEKYIKNPDRFKHRKMTAESRKKRTTWSKVYAKTIKGKAIFLRNAYLKEDIRKGLENDITQGDLIAIIGTPCTYCGHPATGVDRIDNSKGHLMANCVPACKECNVGRMDNFTFEEMIILGKAIKEIKDNRLKVAIKIAI